MNGQIVKALSGFYYVQTQDELVTCKARGKFRKDGISPLVGDYVAITQTAANEGVIDQILPRRNFFARPAVANIDQLVMIISEAIPKADPNVIDRMTVMAAMKQCDVLICINKCDLDEALQLNRIYTNAGFPTLCMSAKTGEGTDELLAHLEGKLSVFTGNSGVGKSSILNALSPDWDLAVAEVSKALGRGKHTTRHIEMFTLPSGARVIDTPGFSSFSFEDDAFDDGTELAAFYPDFQPYLTSCRFTGCTHRSEQGCALLKALDDGKIEASRHTSYLRLYDERHAKPEWTKKNNRH